MKIPSRPLPPSFPAAAGFLLAALAAARGAVTPASLNRSRPNGSVTITATGTAASLDGKPFPLGVATVVRDFGYHELEVTDGAVTLYRFIVRNPARGNTEDGLPTMRLRRIVDDAPAAFAGASLGLMAPAVYPRGLPLPVVARLTKGASAGDAAGDPLFLNGVARVGNYPAQPVRLRRGWGSTVLPAATTAGARDFDASLNGLAARAPVTIEENTAWEEKGGDITGAEEWGANARIFLSTTLKLAPTASLTVGPGAVVRCAPGVEIWARPGASVKIDGTLAAPVVFTPDDMSRPWGGFWLQPQSGANIARLTATGAIFCGWGASDNWFTTPAGEPARSFPHHRNQQPCVATAPGAVCSLTDCALVGPVDLAHHRGAGFATNGGSLLLTRTLVQRCVTGGEQENCPELEIHSSAFLELTEPGMDPDGDGFVDADNDGIYLVPRGHTFRVSRSVFGWTGDDGIDTGADGAGTVTITDSWFENCAHEAVSNSGLDRVPRMIGGVMFNNGQGMECGYGGPHSLVRDSALIGNMVGARYGDNYGNNTGSSGSGTSQYLGDITVENSLLLYNEFHDAWAIDFSRWVYSNDKLILKGSRVTSAGDLAMQNGAEDTGNALWDPVADGPALAPHMPEPNSAVGVDFVGAPRQTALSAYRGDFEARLSTFSSRPVTAGWRVTVRPDLRIAAETEVASGVLTWLPGQTVRRISAPLPEGAPPALVIVSLRNPENAEITGEPLWFFAEQGVSSPEGWGVITLNGGNYLYWTDPAWEPESSTTLGEGSWIPRPDLTSPFPLDGVEGRVFYRLRREVP